MRPLTYDRGLSHLSRSALPGRTSTMTPVLPPSRPERTSGGPARRRMSGTAFWLVIVALVAVSATYQPWKRIPDAPVESAAHEANTLRTVTVDRPSPAATANVVLPATLRPWQTTALHARVNGYLAAWHADLGARVETGDLLAVIDTPELDQELAEAYALAREAAAAAVQAKAERIEAEADLKVAEAQLVRIHAETELARSQLARREKLLASRSVSQEEYDTALRQLEARTADIVATQADISRRRSNLETRTAIIEAREATARGRQANADRLQELQNFKRIVAPIDGVVTRRTAEVGMLVTAGKESLFTIEDVSRIRVQINVPQAYAMQTIPGVTAAVTLPESTLPPTAGTVTRIAESVEAASRTMLAEIELENSAHLLQPGSYAQVSLATAHEHSSWTISANTVSMRVDGPHVAVVNDRNEIELRSVTLGRDLGNRVVVIEGITGSERLVVNPGDGLTNGLQVRVRPSEPAAEVAKK